MSYEPDPHYALWRVTVDFRADRGGDANGDVRVRLDWDDVPAGSPVGLLLEELWRLWYAQRLAQLREQGVRELGTW